MTLLSFANEKKIILMSILPKWFYQIISGEKKWEYRRILIKAQPESRIIFYASKSVHAIVGEAKIDRIIQGPVEYLIEQTINESQEKLEDLRKSFAGKKFGCAIKVKNPRIYEKPISLHEIQKKIPNFRPPQSFYYISEDNPLIQML